MASNGAHPRATENAVRKHMREADWERFDPWLDEPSGIVFEAFDEGDGREAPF